MIPLSVRMTGWMRYRDETVADFSAGTLISICGENGAGKSSIFDAITFALYGIHRLGRQNAGDLISQDADRLSVEFEFEADGTRYMVRRSRTHKAGGADQGLWFWDEGGGEWTPIAGTEKEDSLRLQIERIVRLSPEAFTSSFLLQQNAATEFLDADPKPRFEIVSSLIGLKEYEVLEKRARDEGRAEKQRLDDVTKKLTGYEGVGEEAIASLRAAVDAATEREAAAAALLLAAQACIADAKRYARLSAEIAALGERIARAAELIARKEQIEKDFDLHAKLAEAITRVSSIKSLLDDASRSDAAGADVREQATAIDLDALAAVHVAAAELVAAGEKQAKAAEREHEAAAREERAAHDFATLAASVLTARTRVAECEAAIGMHDARLAAMPRVKQQAQTLRAIRDALPALRELKEAREHLEKLQKDDPAAALQKLAAQQSKVDVDAKAAEKEAAAAEKALAAAQKAAAACRARVEQLTRERDERKRAAAESTCSRCGQPIDKQRAKAEIDDLTAQLGEAQQHAAAAAEAEAAADASCTAARKQRQALAKSLTEIAAKLAAAKERAAQQTQVAAAVEQRLAAALAVAPMEIAKPANAAVTAAAVAKIIASHGDVPKQAAAVEKQLDELRGVEGQRTAAAAERDRASKELAAGEAKLDGRRQEIGIAAEAHARARRLLADVEMALTSARDQLEAARADEASARDALAQARDRRASLELQAAQREQEAAGHRQAAEAFASGLGELGEQAIADPAVLLDVLRGNQQSLADAPGRKHALDAAISDQTASAAQREAMRKEIDAIPEAHRIDAGEAQARVEAATAAAVVAREERDTARQQLNWVEARIEQLDALRAEQASSAERYRLLQKLMKLLGKNGLQGILVTDALTTITNHANSFLRRLTGGSLELRLEKGKGDDIEMRAIDHTCMREARSAKALSGSQKFRCAVAIASGIGQYAGAGGMRSIVIDEGFGSLDVAGQQTMVDELKNLATHMDKVIVVSHLDVFRDPTDFPDRLVVETAGTGSTIRRISS